MGKRRDPMSKGRSLKRKAPVDLEKNDLKRFAGSSESEKESDSDDDNDDESLQEDTGVKTPPGAKPSSRDEDMAKKNRKEDGIMREEGRDDDDEAFESSADEMEEYGEEARSKSGMADAMARILGTRSKEAAAGTKSVVLSKTVTPLQKMAKAEKEREREKREKRRQNRERHLAALHIPLSVATSRPVVAVDGQGGSNGLVKELGMERMHRRVATRGVVALFNAIAQHQKETQNETPVLKKSPTAKTDVKHMTKHGFLDMIKTAAAERSEKAGSTDNSRKIKEVNEKERSVTQSKWNALKDDYMLNSKLKDWDKESSDDESLEIEATPHDDWSSEDEGDRAQNTRRSKRR